MATSPSFAANTLVLTNSNLLVDTFKVNFQLQKSTVYYWRIRPKNECGAADWVGPFSFSTIVEVCNTLEANDLPKAISSNGTPTVESKINVPFSGIVSDVNIKKFQGSHSFFKDLEAHLVGPDGTDVLLFSNKCPQTANFNFGFDDGAASTFNCPPPNNGAFYLPTGMLNSFNGKNIQGEWILRVKDNVISSGGTLAGFELEFCSSAALNAPYIVNNLPLVLFSGTNAAIGSDLLLVEDADNSPSELIYTLVTTPKHGRLEKNWTGEMKAGDQFNQTDINTGAIRFFDYGGNPGAADEFRFTVTDGNGGYVAGTFNIMLDPLAAEELDNTLGFDLAPNPADDQIRLSFSQSLRKDAQVVLFNAAGQTMKTWNLGAGSNGMTLQVQDMPPGVYALSVQDNSGKTTKKVVIR
ncbi:MAG: T9SS type A sorting domain-containing protein [Lewinellaceae bacterium]|nr:T9SS type A sorting domain-containing protein [Lewinellaceae bacterium]